MNVFGYLRVSSSGQIDGGGLDRQRDTINAYCAAKGFHVLKWFSDEGVSGTVEGMERPGFASMMESVSPGTAEVIVIEQADRLARDLVVGEFMITEARRVGARVLAVAGDVDLTNTSDPSRVLIRQVLGALAQWEKTNLVRRLRAARDRKSNQMGRRCEARPRWETKPGNERIAQEIVDTVKMGGSLRQLAYSFNHRRIPTPGGQQYWSHRSMQIIYDRITVPPPEPPLERRVGDATLLQHCPDVLS